MSSDFILLNQNNKTFPLRQTTKDYLVSFRIPVTKKI